MKGLQGSRLRHNPQKERDAISKIENIFYVKSYKRLPNLDKELQLQRPTELQKERTRKENTYSTIQLKH